MIGTAIDYSAGFPGAQAIKRAGHLGAVRYIGFPDRRKCTNQGEFADFDNHQIGMALVFENTTTDWRGGFGAGQLAGRRGRDHANAIGFSADRPIYMAVDQDVVKSGEFATMVEYLRGAGTSLGGAELTGVYGEADVIDRARDAGVASWYWQTSAWSRGRRAEHIHLYQKVGAVSVNGIACDINEVLADDWGQHNYEGDNMPSVQEIVDAIKSQVLAGDWRFDRNSNPIDMLRQASSASLSADSKLDILTTKMNALMGTLSDDEANVIRAMALGNAQLLAAVAAIPPGGTPTDQQLDLLADRLRDGLGEEVAEVIGEKLIRPIAS